MGVYLGDLKETAQDTLKAEALILASQNLHIFFFNTKKHHMAKRGGGTTK